MLGHSYIGLLFPGYYPSTCFALPPNQSTSPLLLPKKTTSTDLRGLDMFSHALHGNYTNFGVFELYSVAWLFRRGRSEASGGGWPTSCWSSTFCRWCCFWLFGSCLSAGRTMYLIRFSLGLFFAGFSWQVCIFSTSPLPITLQTAKN